MTGRGYVLRRIWPSHRAARGKAGNLHDLNPESKDLVMRLAPAVSAFCVGLCREPFHVHRYADHGVA